MILRKLLFCCMSRVVLPLCFGLPPGLTAAQEASPEPVVILLRESFDQAAGSLDAPAESAWKSARGSSRITVQDRYAFIPGEAPGEVYVTRPFTVAPRTGAVLEASLILRLDPRGGVNPTTESSTGVVFQFVSADGNQRRGRLAVRVNADGSCQLGCTAKSSSAIAWAESEVSRFEEHAVVVRYDSVSGRASLWVDAVNANVGPVAQAQDADAFLPAQISLQQSGKASSPDVRISQLVVRALAAGEGGIQEAPSPVKVAASAPVQPKTPAEPGVEPPGKAFKVFLLLGQSNMAGRGVVEPGDRVGNPRILAQQADGRWVVAREPLHWDKPRVAGVGPGLAFARALLPKLTSAAFIGLIPAAFGGTRVAWWQKDYDGTQRWPNGETYFQHAVTCARAAPKSSLAGVLWIQGESDKGTAELDGGSAYRRDFHKFIRDFRAEVGAPDLPFVVATLKPWSTGNSHALNAVFLALPKEISHTAVVDTNAPALEGLLKNKTDDPPHYDSPSARRLGELFAREMVPLLKTDAR
jgi:hypothetical protein